MSSSRDEAAKEALRTLLEAFTTGRILGLLSELHTESGDEAEAKGDLTSSKEFRAIAATLDLVGVGIDAKYPS